MSIGTFGQNGIDKSASSARYLGRVRLRRASMPDTAGEFDGIVLRRWRVEDAPAVQDAVLVSLEHLRPWMGWVAEEPATLAERRRMIIARRRDWLRGTEFIYGAFLGELAIGAFGLHRRIGPRGLELGYWVRDGYTGRRIGLRAAELVTAVALRAPAVDHVEIHHDKANVRSGRIPERLGFTLVGEFPDRIEAPGEIGVECRWRITGRQWRARR